MKAVIVKAEGRRAAALTEQGEFIMLRNDRYRVGDSVEVKSLFAAKRRRRMLTFASAAAAFLCLLGGSAALYLTPYSLVSLDVNPSVEYTLNRFDRVLDLSGVNSDGTALVASLDVTSLRYRPIDQAIAKTIEELRLSSYLVSSQSNYVVLAASAENTLHAEVLAESLSACLTNETDLTVESTAVSKEQADAAHALGTTAGKLYVVEQLSTVMEGDPFSTDEWLGRSVGDILDEYERRGGRLPGELTENGQLSPDPADPTQTPSASPEATPIPTPTAPTMLPTPSESPVPTHSMHPAATSSPSPAPSATPEPTLTPLPTVSPSPPV